MAYVHIARINENGLCDSMWSGSMPEGYELKENEIDVTDNPHVMGKRCVNGEWVEVPQPEPEPDPVMVKLEEIEEQVQASEEMEDFYESVCKEAGL